LPRDAAIGRARRSCSGQAADRFAALDRGQFTHPARWQQGRLLGGEEGRRLTAAAASKMAEQGISNPERWGRPAHPRLQRLATPDLTLMTPHNQSRRRLPSSAAASPLSPPPLR
jgi:hypothetical protein